MGVQAAHLTQGASLPPVTLMATDGTSVQLARLRGGSVVTVYPWTGRPGLPNPPGWDDIAGAHGSRPELEGFADLFARFTQMGTRIFGLSRQDTDYQREAVERLRLPFCLLSDAEDAFAGALGLPSFMAGTETYLSRLTLIVRNGHIETVFDPVPDPACHAANVLEWLERQT